MIAGNGRKLLLISGTPAAGKDTVTGALQSLDPRYASLRKHKSGSGGRSDASYIHVSDETFQSMVDADGFVQHHGRYGRRYGVARAELDSLWQAGRIPVVHVGRYENLAAFATVDAYQFSVLLAVSREVTAQRLETRHHGDADEIRARLSAYAEERTDFAQHVIAGEELAYDIVIETGNRTPEMVAHLIIAAASVAWDSTA